MFYSLPLSLEVLFLQRIIYFKLVILHWVIADLQCCDRLRWTARDSAMRVHVCILPQTPLSTRLPQNIKQSSLCAVPGELCLLVIHVKQASVHLSTPNSLSSPPTILPPDPSSSFPNPVSLFLFPKEVHLCHFFTRLIYNCGVIRLIMLLLLSHFSRVRLCATP